MAIDLQALKAKLAAQKPATPPENTNETNTGLTQVSTSAVNTIPATTNTQVSQGVPAADEPVIPTVNAPEKLGTSKTSEIDHMDFLAKMNDLSVAIHKQHPTMPVLLMQIHKQLRSDPELVTTLDDDAIGIIVKGLQIQTKTELVAEAVKKTGGRSKKNPALSVDML